MSLLTVVGYCCHLCGVRSTVLRLSRLASTTSATMNMLRQPLRASLRRCYATATTTSTTTPPFVPPASLPTMDGPPRARPDRDRPDREKSIPSSPTFYTGRSEFYDHIATLESAVENTHSVLRSLQLLPLPAFARDSLPPAQPMWKSRDAMSSMFMRKLTTARYRRLITLLAQLDEYERIADAAGHIEMQNGIASILSLFERPDKAAQLARKHIKLAKFDKYGRTHTVGKRKESTARVWIIPVQPTQEKKSARASAPAPTPAPLPIEALSTEPVVDNPFARTESSHPKVDVTMSQILVNNIPLNEFFASPADRARIVRPLKLAGVLGAFNVFALVRGGGTTGQSGAITHGIARGIVAHVPEVEIILRKGESDLPICTMSRLTGVCSRAASLQRNFSDVILVWSSAKRPVWPRRASG